METTQQERPAASLLLGPMKYLYTGYFVAGCLVAFLVSKFGELAWEGHDQITSGVGLAAGVAAVVWGWQNLRLRHLAIEHDGVLGVTEPHRALKHAIVVGGVARARMLEEVCSDFGVKGAVKDVKPGPVVTLFLADMSDEVKIAATKAIAALKYEPARDALIDLLAAEETAKRVQTACVQALCEAELDIKGQRERVEKRIAEPYYLDKSGTVKKRTS